MGKNNPAHCLRCPTFSDKRAAIGQRILCRRAERLAFLRRLREALGRWVTGQGLTGLMKSCIFGMLK